MLSEMHFLLCEAEMEIDVVSRKKSCFNLSEMPIVSSIGIKVSYMYVTEILYSLFSVLVTSYQT